MGSDSIPQKSLSDESIDQGLVCAHIHSIAWTQKILTFMSYMDELRHKKTPNMHHPQRQNVSTSMVGLKNGHMRKDPTPNGEPQRYSWGMVKKKKDRTQTG